MKKFLVRYSAATFAAVIVALSGCGGGGGDATVPGGGDNPPVVTPPVTSAVVTPTPEAIALAATAGGEACATCHTGDASIARSGPGHQADYDQLYQNGAIKIANLAFVQSTTTAAGDTSKVSFKMTKNGAAFDCTQADTIGSYWAAYDPATNTFPSDLSLAGTTTYDAATGVCTITKKLTAAADIATLTAITGGANGEITLYGADEILEKPAGTHLQKAKFPFAGILRLGPVMGAATAPFTSKANVSGCENCHTQPFNKHAYISGHGRRQHAGHRLGHHAAVLCLQGLPL